MSVNGVGGRKRRSLVSACYVRRVVVVVVVVVVGCGGRAGRSERSNGVLICLEEVIVSEGKHVHGVTGVISMLPD